MFSILELTTRRGDANITDAPWVVSGAIPGGAFAEERKAMARAVHQAVSSCP
jgi:hypothetical protein